MKDKVLTGRKVFFITATAFAVIIGVNLFMAYKAVDTFPGLETDNSYVASQSFEAERSAQEALLWTVSAEISNGQLRMWILDRYGLPVNPPQLSAVLGRATTAEDDSSPDFIFDGQAHVAIVNPGPGKWTLRVQATAEDGTEFRQRVAIWVRNPL